jgi:hypothetical protein
MAAESKTAIGSHVRFLGGIHTAPKITLEEKNRVIVNIWTSEENKAVRGANVGHISIATPHRYISLWPGPRENKKIVNKLYHKWNRYFGMRPTSWKSDYMEDCISEAMSENYFRKINDVSECKDNEEIIALIPEIGLMRILSGEPVPSDTAVLFAVTPLQANIRLALFGLKIDKIHAEFDTIKSRCPGWRLVGSNCLSRLSTDSPENCASVAYRMLCVGGMYRGADKVKASSETSSVTSPDLLAQHLIKAKEKERTERPETSSWTFIGESDLAALIKAYSSEPKEGSSTSCIMA